MRKTLHAMSILLCISSFYAVISDDNSERIPKVQTEHSTMCGCNYVYWTNHLESDLEKISPGSPDNESKITDECYYGGPLKKCNYLCPRGDDIYYGYEWPGEIVECYMKWNDSKLTGYFKSDINRYHVMYGRYKLLSEGPAGPWHLMESIELFGNGEWKQFNYYFDFTTIEVSVVNIGIINTDFGGGVIYIDELELCRYCEGELEDEYPILSNLEVLNSVDQNAFDLVPPFSSYNTKYSIKVPMSVPSVIVIPTLAGECSEADYEIQVGGSVVTSGSQSPPVPLSFTPEKNQIIYVDIKDISVDPCKGNRTYAVVIETDVPIPDATLSNLQFVNEGNYLDPVFARFTENYNGIVLPGTENVKLIPTLTDPFATLTVNGVQAENQRETDDIDITVNNVITIVVTARDGITTKTYTVTCVDNVPDVFFEQSSLSDNERLANVSVKVFMEPPPSVDITVPVTVSGTADPVTDFQITTTSLTFNPATGVSRIEREIPITILDDDIPEQNKTIILTLGDPSPAGSANKKGPFEFTYTIVDDDRYTVEFEQTSSAGYEPLSFSKVINVPVKINNGPVLPNEGPVEVTFKINTSLTDASEGNTLDFTVDYTPIIWEEGDNANKNLILTIYNDDNLEPNEKVVIEIESVKGGKEGSDITYQYTIIDNENIGSYLYVDESATSGNNNGTSWENAFIKLQDALDKAQEFIGTPGIADIIYVAQGTYYPDESSFNPDITNNDLSETFTLVEGVNVIGGFPAGGGATPDPAVNVTTLSGDIDQAGGLANNSYHVVTANVNAPINGFTISDGNADGAGGADTDKGGGFFVTGGNLRVDNCRFTNNSASYSGGGICQYGGDVAIIGCIFDNNNLTNPDELNGGSAIFTTSSQKTDILNSVFSNNSGSESIILYVDQGNYTIANCIFFENNNGALNLWNHGALINVINCTFVKNAGLNAFAYLDYSNPSSVGNLSNSIFWHNTCTNDIMIIPGENLNISNCDIEIGDFVGSNIKADPKFTGTASPDQLTLQDGSACVDRGDNAIVQSLSITTDIAGNPRIYNEIGGGIVDMGAYESNHSIVPLTDIYVDVNAGGNNDGLSWVNAFINLQDALDLGRANPGIVNTIHVALGTYYPDLSSHNSDIVNNDRTESFFLVDGVEVIGGYPTGGGPTPDPAANLTTLSGDIDQAGGLANNSYHVVTAANNAILDGFSVSDGNANVDDGTNDRGAAITSANSNLTIKNCRFLNNYALKSGGALFCLDDGVSNTIELHDSYFENNTVTQVAGGAVHVNGDALSAYTCTFTNNSAIPQSGSGLTTEGGAVKLYGGTLILDKCNFTGNSTGLSAPEGGRGGALALENSQTSTISNCTFDANSTVWGGGAIRFHSSASGEHKVINCVFFANSGEEAGGVEIFAAAGVEFINCTFVKNVAPSGRAMSIDECDVTVTNCIIYHNEPVGNDLDIFLVTPSKGENVYVSYTNIEQSGFAPGNNNISTPPKFSSYPSIPSNVNQLQLSEYSPSINRGYNTIITDNNITEDIAGNPRIQNGAVDMGAYESPYQIVLPYTITVAINGNGTTDPLPGNYEVFDGDNFPIEATPDLNNHFNIWTETGGLTIVDETDPTTEIQNVNSNGTVTANFAIDEYTITFDKNDAGATGTMAPQTIASGATEPLTLNGFSKTGWSFAGWAETPTGLVVYADGADYTMGTANVTLYAKWTKTWTLTITNDAHGTTTPSGNVTVDDNVNISISASPYSGYVFYLWEKTTGAGTVTFGNANQASTTVNLSGGDATIRANFKFNQADMYVDANAGGTNQGNSWANAFTKFQDALAVARYSQPTVQNIHVAAGNYYPDEAVYASITNNDQTITFTFDFNNVSILGGYPIGGGTRDYLANISKLSGDIRQDDNYSYSLTDPSRNNSNNSYHIVACNGSVTLDGVTIEGGYGYNIDNYKGSAVDGFGHPTLKNCTIKWNICDYGNVYAPVSVENCTFSNNECRIIGGAALYATDALQKLENCTFSSNHSQNWGGAIYLRDNSLTIKNCTFDQNTAEIYGGAMYLTGSGVPKILNCNFLSNNTQLAGPGGAIYFDTGIQGSNITNCTFNNNYSTWGGAIHYDIDQGNHVISNSIFYKTYAEGAAVRFETNNNPTIKITNCTFYSNVSSAIFFVAQMTGTAEITNCIFWGNGVTPIIWSSGDDIIVSYCDIEYGDWASPSNNNIKFDPQFNGTSAPEQLTLRDVSPCVNLGDHTKLPLDVLDLDNDGNTTETLPLDRDLNTRVQQGQVDMGAYESPHSGVNVHTLTITNNGNGTTSPPPGDYKVYKGDDLPIEASASQNNHFVNWTVTPGLTIANPTAPSTQLTNVTTSGTVTANFALNQYTLTITADNGSVTKNPDQPTYAHGTVVTLTPSPATGHHFENWEGHLTGNANPAQITMDSDKYVTAIFDPNQYSVSYSGNGHTGGAPPATANYLYGAIVTVSGNTGSLVKTGYTFSGWNTAANGSGTSYSPGETFTMGAGNVTLYAQWTINTYTLSVISDGNGTVTKNPNYATYTHGTVVTLTANPNTGYHFDSWEGDLNSITNPDQIIMDDDKTVYLYFAPNQYTVTFNAQGGTTPNPTSKSVYYGAQYGTLATTSRTGYTFGGWWTGAGGTGTQITSGTTITTALDHTLYAKWTINEYHLNITITPSQGGGVIANPNWATYPHGTEVSLMANAAQHYHFNYWSGDLYSVINPDEIIMDSDKSVTANFTINVYQLTVVPNPTGAGIITQPSSSPITVNYGEWTSIDVDPNRGFSFANWIITPTNGEIDNPSSKATSVRLMTGDATVQANLILAAQPIAYWDCHEGSGSILHDVSGTATNGTIMGATWVSGVQNYALRFNPANSGDGGYFVEMNPSRVYDIEYEITVCAWVKLTGLTGDHQVVTSKWYNGLVGANEQSYTLEFDPSGKPQFAVKNASSGIRAATSNDAISLNTWTFIVGTYDGGSVKIYVNRADLKDSKSLSGMIFVGGSPVMIGKHDHNTDINPFKGYIDDVRIYGASLTETEIQSLYDSYQY